MTATTDTGRTAWLEWRQGGIGASDVAAILGLSPWASPWSVWADKAGLLPPQPEDEAMAAGRWLEAAIGPWFTNTTGLAVHGEQTWCTNRKHDHHRCTVDGFVADAEQLAIADSFDMTANRIALGLLEIKVTGPGRRWDEIPAHYQAQGQWQMHVTGLDRVWFAVLMGRRLDVHELARDQDDIDYMVERVDAFWHDFVETGTPPPTDGHDATARALAEVYPGHMPDVSVEADDVMRRTIEAWRAAKAAEKDAAAEVQLHAAAMKAALGDAEELTVDGQRVVSWRTQTRRALDQRALKAAHPDLVAEFTTESTVRVLRSHAPKEQP